MVSTAGKPARTGVRKALSLSFIQAVVSSVFTFGSVVIVSHILTPAEIGVFSVAAGLVALVHMLRDFGVSEFIVQEPALDDDAIRTVFTINLLIAWTLGVVLFATSGVAGTFYGNAGVSQVLQVLSVVFMLLPFGTTTMALLRRDLAFVRIVKIKLAESTLRSVSMVAFAYLGFSYMSMAWSSLVGIVTMVAGCAIWGVQHRAHGLGLRGWRRVLHFGSSRTISDIATQVGGQSANLIIGRMLGMVDTGLYSRGYGIVNMYNDRFVGAVNGVAFPAFAREHRETGTAPALFMQSLVYLTGISWPFFSAGVLLAFPLMRILFGNQWDAAVPLMRWLCGAAIVGTLTYQCNPFLVALGKISAATRVEVTSQLIRIGITIAAAFYSVVAVAAVQVLVYGAAAVLYFHCLHRHGLVSIGASARALVPSGLVTLATCAIPAVIAFSPGLLRQHMLPAFAIAVVGGCLGWLACVRAIRHPILDELRRVGRNFPSFSRLVLG